VAALVSAFDESAQEWQRERVFSMPVFVDQTTLDQAWQDLTDISSKE
jgi:hypothetical protein